MRGPLRPIVTVVVLLATVAGAVGQTLKQIAHVAVEPIRPANADHSILPLDDGRSVLVHCCGNAHEPVVKRIRTADWKVVATVSASSALVSHHMVQGQAGLLHPDPANKRVLLPTTSRLLFLPAAGDSLDAVQEQEIELERRRDEPELVPSFRTCIRTKAGVDLLWLRHEKTAVTAVRSPLASKATRAARKLFANPTDATGREQSFGVRWVFTAATGRTAYLAIEDAHLETPVKADAVLKPAAEKSCVAVVDLDNLEVDAGTNLSCPDIHGLIVNRDETLCVCGGGDGTVHFVDLKTHRPLGTPLQLSKWAIGRLYFTPDEKHLVAIAWVGERFTDPNCFVIDVASKTVVRSAVVGGNLVSLAFSPDGERLYSLAFQSGFQAWDFKGFLEAK